MHILKSIAELSNVVLDYFCWHPFFAVGLACAQSIIETIIGGQFSDEVDGYLITEAAVESEDIGMIEKEADFDFLEYVLFYLHFFNLLFIEYFKGADKACSFFDNFENLTVGS